MVRGIGPEGKQQRFAPTPWTEDSEDWQALDSTSVAAHASRRRLLNGERLPKRRTAVDDALRCLVHGEPVTHQQPGWLAKTQVGLHEQRQRYEYADQVLRQCLVVNAQKPSNKRKPAEKILVSPADPDAILARDKFDVLRPLYS